MNTRKRIMVDTNSFLITRMPTKVYYMYDVVFSPIIKQKQKRNRLFHHLQTTVRPATFNPRLVYDGNAIAYSPGRLDLAGNSGATFCVMLGRNEELAADTPGATQIRINLTSSAPIDPSDVSDTTKNRLITQRSITATNLMQLIVRQGPNQAHTNNGRAYFPGKEVLQMRGTGIELWRGIFQSVRPALGRMILTIDTSTAAVYKSGPLIDVMLDFLNARNIRDLDMSDKEPRFHSLEKFLKRLRIIVKTGNNAGRSRIKCIRGLVPAGGEFTFHKESEGKTVTVAEHFKAAYNMDCHLPRIVGISLAGKKDSGADVVPAEFCMVEPGQLYRHKIPESATAQMVKFATMRPQERLDKIKRGAADYHTSEYIRESGMVVDTKHMAIKAAILPPQKLQYGGKDMTTVDNGSWNVVRKKLYDPAHIKSWALINVCPERVQIRQCEQFAQGLHAACVALGMTVAPLQGIYSAGGHNLENDFAHAMKDIKDRTQDEDVVKRTILIVILPQNAAAIRTAVKRWGDIDQGIRTQCIREGKVAGANSQYYNNVALKLNARLGGTNLRSVSPIMAELDKQCTMIMGADVGHPSPGVQKPSVTSLVYSHDRFVTQYAAFSALQAPRMEIIADLRTFVRNAVNNWGQKNRMTPARIFFFRDGVSEGEYVRVSEDEIQQIKAGIDDVWAERNLKDAKPLLTFIVVGKGHHTVFFPRSGDGPADRTGNCVAGSVIDGDEITHPANENFYLQSHSAIQGTCRSSHYIVLLNENNQAFPVPAIQELAYTLCHVYAKATRSVSIPAPVYYADLTCTRGPFHIKSDAVLTFDDGMSTSSGSQSAFDLEGWKSAWRPTNDKLTNTMYFI